MTSLRGLRPRQTSTAAVLAHTPLKETRRTNVLGRRSLSRTAKVLAEVDGYTDQLFSPPKRHILREENGAETPATKISKKMSAKLVIRSPESLEIANDENVPPAGDTVGRRLPRDVRGAKKASSPSCNRTPLRMKIKKFDDVAKICESSVRYPSSTAHLSHSRQVASDACLMPNIGFVKETHLPSYVSPNNPVISLNN
ncbi:hypothetical protein COOONC_05465 [Cooperia oncophora]